MPPPFEIPVFSASAAQRAASLGASRIELNRAGSYAAGGLTPSFAELVAVKGLAVPVRVMIRPRGKPASDADFIYSDEEYQQMLEDVDSFKASGLLSTDRGDGFVFGVLKQRTEVEGRGLTVDRERNAEMLERAKPFKCVFHRAFDDVVGSVGGNCDDLGAMGGWKTDLEDVINCGFDAILTSGGPGDAPYNGVVLARILVESRGRIEIIIGGGVRSNRMKKLVAAVPTMCPGVAFHSSCLTPGTADEIDELEVKGMMEKLHKLFPDRTPAPGPLFT